MNYVTEKLVHRSLCYLRGIVILLLVVLSVQLFVVWQQKLSRTTLDNYIESQEIMTSITLDIVCPDGKKKGSATYTQRSGESDDQFDARVAARHAIVTAAACD